MRQYFTSGGGPPERWDCLPAAEGYTWRNEGGGPRISAYTIARAGIGSRSSLARAAATEEPDGLRPALGSSTRDPGDDSRSRSRAWSARSRRWLFSALSAVRVGSLRCASTGTLASGSAERDSSGRNPSLLCGSRRPTRCMRCGSSMPAMSAYASLLSLTAVLLLIDTRGECSGVARGSGSRRVGVVVVPTPGSAPFPRPCLASQR